jgi:hypothetical protein
MRRAAVVFRGLVGFLALTAVLAMAAESRRGEGGPAADPPALPSPVLKEMGDGVSIGAEAESWEALVEKVRPAFTWGGRDMRWIGQDEQGNPQFTLDRAYVFQPEGELARWALLAFGDGADARVFSLNYIRRTARLYEEDKIPVHDGGSGDYAVVKSHHPAAGMLYEIGWESIQSAGSSAAIEERRLYLLRDGNGRWHFVGEGPGPGAGKSGYNVTYLCSVESSVTWTGVPDGPVRIEFTVRDSRIEGGEMPEDGVPRRRRDEYSRVVLAGRMPAALQWIDDRPYMLAEKGDTFDVIVSHLATWTIGWDTNRGDSRKRILQMWAAGLVELNPRLPRGEIPEGARIRLLRYNEMLERLDLLQKSGGAEPDS